MATITDKQLSAKVSKTVWLIEDAPRGHGRFVVKLTPNGQPTFYFRYTTSTGKRDFYPLGGYNQKGINGLTLREARSRAGELSRRYQSGTIDIRAQLEAEEATRKAEQEADLVRMQRELEEHTARKTVSDLFEHWATVDLIRRKDKGAEMRRMFTRDILPLIGSIASEDIRKRHITEVTDALLSRGVPRLAKVAFASMRQMFRFAVDRDIVEADPTATIRKVKIGGPDTERDRTLSDNEIRLLQQQIPDARLLATTEAAVWITLSTCCRIGELLNAEWQHVDLHKHEWLIPAQNSKNGKPHIIFLSAFANGQFKLIFQLTGTERWCYPNRNSSGPVSSKTITKQLTDRQRPSGNSPMTGRSMHTEALLLPGGKWTPHDLRRTGATLMVEAGALPEVAERCLNHTEENKVKRTYQRYSYAKEMNHAWQLLGERLELLTHKDAHNVIATSFGKQAG
jgi:integrase